MSGDERECNTSFDCDNDGIARLCYESSNFREETSFCDCTNFYGWTGSNCDMAGSNIIYSRISLLLYILFNPYVIYYTFTVLYLFLRAHLSSENRKAINPVFYVLIFDLLAGILFFIQVLLRVRPLVDSTAFETYVQESYIIEGFIEVGGVNARGATLVLSLSFMFLTLCGVVIIMSWLDVILNITKIFPQDEFWSEKKLRRFVIVFVFISLFIFLTLSIARLQVEVNAALATQVFILAFANVIGYFCFITKLTRLKKKYNIIDSLSLIKSSFRTNMICLTLMFVTAALYAIFSFEYEKNFEIGKINPLFVVADIGGLSGLFMIWSISKYSNKVRLKLF